MTGFLRSIDDLARAEFVPNEATDALRPVAERYAISLSPVLAGLIDRADPGDPIARQFVPTAAELIGLPEERADPIGDAQHTPVHGIVHRHRDRVLLKAVAACPVYCRFCFRRETIGPQSAEALTQSELEGALDYIEAHPEISEVILTGGDPFILSTRRVRELNRRLAAIRHVRIVRWHTRVPVVEPEKIDAAFVSALSCGGKAVWVALHANHSREFSPAAREAIARLVDAGIALVSQSVLLKGVNADVETLAELMQTFVSLRIKPYYLHHPDLAPGTSHFRITVEEGLGLMRALRTRVSGLAVPAYVLDIPGGYAKIALGGADAEQVTPGSWRFRDHDGRWHNYPPSA